MSVDRCIEALSNLDANLDRVLRNPGTQSAEEQGDELRDLIRDLILDIDLRTNSLSNKSMTPVESDVYLPVIEKILALVALESPKFSDQLGARREEAKGLARVALTRAVACKG